MNRVCVVGDSHVAALKKGWELVASRYAGLTLTFFAAPMPLATDFSVSAGRLVPANEKLRKFLETTSGGLSQIGPDHDRFVVCGLGLSLARVMVAYSRLARVKSVMAPDENLKALSAEAFLDLACEMVRGAPAFSVVEKLRQISHAPVTVIANPIPGHKGREEFWEKLEKNGDTSNVIDVFIAACERVCKTHDASFLPQPAKTRRDGTLTRRRYTLNSARLSFGNDDSHHMNAAYGAIVLAAALDMQTAAA